MGDDQNDTSTDGGFERDPLVVGGIYWLEGFPQLLSSGPIFSLVQPEIISRWSNMIINIDNVSEVESYASKIYKNKHVYDDVEKVTGVPWFVIGIIHEKEAGLNFKCHLHNGDSLNNRTVQVPKGRPKIGTPPFTWEESAVDALDLDGMTNNSDWSIAKIAFMLERFNGEGYRYQDPPVPTPYLWAFSNQYDRGYYVKDGVFDPNVVARNCGAMPILKKLIDMFDIYIS